MEGWDNNLHNHAGQKYSYNGLIICTWFYTHSCSPLFLLPPFLTIAITVNTVGKEITYSVNLRVFVMRLVKQLHKTK